jgi:hypothetical protein
MNSYDSPSVGGVTHASRVTTAQSTLREVRVGHQKDVNTSGSSELGVLDTSAGQVKSL